MATDPLTDAIVARRLIERAVQWDQAPALTSAEVDDLMLMAVSQDADGVNQYTAADLNGAAAAGWQWKAGKVSGSYTMSLGDGVKLNRSEVHAMCLSMAADYLLGEASVLGMPRRRTGIVSIRTISDIGTVT